MTTIPPPPVHPPTIGQTEPTAEPEWWRKSGPWDRTPKSVPVSLGKTRPAPAAKSVAEDVEDQDLADGEQAGQHGEPWAYRVHHNLRGLINQTPEEQAAAARLRREEKYQQQGETEEEREARHEREQRSAERHASILWRQPQSERTLRFRRWCILTTTSAVLGYQMGAVQLAAHLPLPVGVAALVGAWGLDLWLRGLNPRRDDRRGPVRVSEVRGAGALIVLVIARIPVASALVGVLGLAPLITILSTHH
ncbi:hypothetical protein ACH4E7_06910 [Kitasatospora sp. NPDC018058]|uniref:hypothetical protein n=1 Tax=Kitasatospora sp. NPDC018058 TaxID=3364025 RepID=UPI0037BF6217